MENKELERCYLIDEVAQFSTDQADLEELKNSYFQTASNHVAKLSIEELQAILSYLKRYDNV